MYAIDFDNPWIATVPSSRRPAILILLVAVALLAAILFGAKALGPAFAGLLGGVFAAAPAGWREALVAGALQIAVFSPLFLVAVVGASLYRRRPWAATAQAWPAAPLGVAAGAFGLGASALVAWTAGAITTGAAPPASAGSLAFGAVLVLFQASAEEVYFRGWLQPVLCARWGPWLGLLVTSGLFAGLHGIANAHGPLAFVNLFLGGLLFGLLALRTGGLVAPIAAHFAWNWSESGLFGLDPSPTGSLLHLALGGPSLWSGGADLLNGSPATTCVLGVMIVALQLVKNRPRANANPESA